MDKTETQTLIIREIAFVLKKYYKYDYSKMLKILDILTKTITVFKNYEERHKDDNEKVGAKT